MLGRELSTIDRYHIRLLTEGVLRRYFSGDYDLDIYADVYNQYCLDAIGYTSREVERKLRDVFKEDSRKHAKILLHRVHARAHHE